ncbi:MAG: hypothetical protein ACP6IY_19610 [Promethearchaeia archaeon]
MCISLFVLVPVQALNLLVDVKNIDYDLNAARRAVSRFIIIILIVLFFSLIFSYFNQSSIPLLNFIMNDPIIILLPYFILLGAGLSFLKTFGKYFSEFIRSKKVTIEEKNVFSRNKDIIYKIYNHVRLSILLIFVLLTALSYLLFPLIYNIFITFSFLFIFNYAYSRYSDTFIRIREKQDDSEELDSDFWYVPFHSILLICIFISLCIYYALSYFFGLTDFAPITNQILLYIAQNPVLLYLGILSLMVIIIIPIAKITFYIIVYIADYIYRHSLSKYFYSVILSLIGIVILKVILFNSGLIEYDPVLGGILSAAITTLISVLTMKISKKFG